MRARLLVLSLVVASCSKTPPPAPVATPVDVTVTMPDGSTRNATMNVVFVPVPEDVYVDLMVAVAGRMKVVTGRSVGIYQPDDASPLFLRAVQAVTQRYAYRPIVRSDFSVVCGTTARQQTSITRATPSCSMKYVENVVQFTSVRMTRDSGFVGASNSRVPAGTTKSVRTHYCVTLAKKSGEWEATHSEQIVEPARCPRRWG